MSTSNHFGGFVNIPNNLNLQTNNNNNMPPSLASHLEKFRQNKSIDNFKTNNDETPNFNNQQRKRDPNTRPVNRLTVDLIKTYKIINEVGIFLILLQYFFYI